jgi:DNA invertase Pin-like site-specific DNA recombinase
LRSCLSRLVTAAPGQRCSQEEGKGDWNGAWRERILRRAQHGRKAAKTKGVRFGRKPKLTEHQQAEALDRMRKGESTRQVAKTFGVSHMTIGRLQG